ncbi:MAG: SH3 domain-containing protein [Lachnospiraceae bacterium]
MNKLCRNALASCLAATFAVGGGIAVPAASGASLEQDTAVAGMAVSLDNYYASSQTPEADIMDYIRYIVASAQEKKIIPVFTVNATTKEDGSVVFGTSLVSKDASEKEEGLVSVMASLNVRNKPSVSSNVIGYLYSNCVVSIYDTVDNSEGSWYLIKVEM